MAEELEPLWITTLLLRVQERPLDVISVCTLPGQSACWHGQPEHVGLYQLQVQGAEFGLGVRCKLVLTSTWVPVRPLGNPPVVVCLGSVPMGRPVAGQLSGTQLCARLTHNTLCVPVLGSRVLSPSRSPALKLGHQGRWGRGAPDYFESVGIFGRF